MFWGAKKIEKKFEKYFSNRIEKLHKMAFTIWFFLKFEIVEKTVNFRAKFFLHCTLSVILGVISNVKTKWHFFKF